MDLAQRWRGALDAARAIITVLPADHVGEAVLTSKGELFTGGAAAIHQALVKGQLVFHRGRLGGALPELKA